MSSVNPLERYDGKESPEYKYFSNDFQAHREVQWMSILYQAAPSITLPDVRSVLELGGGRDVTKALVSHFGIEYTSVDLADTFFPDVISTIEDYDSGGKQYDLVCSFQCLEHNPLYELEGLLEKMKSLSSKHVLISVPYSGAWFSLAISIRLPKIFFSKSWYGVSDRLGGRTIDQAPLEKLPQERRHSPHWWEVGRRNLPRKKFEAMARNVGLKLVTSRHNPLFPHHLFLHFERTD